jgi:PAS domain S-box-containing protein
MDEKRKILSREELRQRAEELIGSYKTVSDRNITDEDLIKLIHQLEVYKMELEIQNTELVEANQEAQESLNKYSELFDFAPVGYLTISPEGLIMGLNFMAAKLLGKERSLLIKRSLSQFLHPESKTAFAELISRILVNPIPESITVRIEANEGNLLTASINGIRHEGANECLITLQDITEQKKDQEELMLAKHQAEESDKLKSAFLANMSHEIRTPMNGILGFTELLKEPYLTGEEQKRYIEIIEKSGDRMLNLINDIIDISKIDSGQVQLLKSKLNIVMLAREICDFFRPEAESKGLSIIIDSKLNETQEIIYSDAEKLATILSNLIKNSIKFTESGSVTVGFRQCRACVEVSIKDTGIGIGRDHWEYVFDRFRRASMEWSKHFPGSGLGLPISKAFVELLGGKIWIKSKLGKGSTFFFTVPEI